MGIQSEKGDRSSCYALFDSEQTSGNAKIQDLTANFVRFTSPLLSSCDREQEVVELNSKLPCGMTTQKARKFRSFLPMQERPSVKKLLGLFINRRKAQYTV